MSPTSCWREFLAIVALCVYFTISIVAIGAILPWSDDINDGVNFLKYLTISGTTLAIQFGLISIEILSRIFVSEVLIAHAQGLRPWCEEDFEELWEMQGGILPKYSRISYAFKKRFGYLKRVEEDGVDDADCAEKGTLSYGTLNEV